MPFEWTVFFSAKNGYHDLYNLWPNKMYAKSLILHNIKYIHMTLITAIIIYEPHTPEKLSSGFANNKGAEQPAHPCRLIRVFVIRFLGRSYLNLLQVKFQSEAEEIGWVSFCRKPRRQVLSRLGPYSPRYSDFIWDFGKLPFPEHLGKDFIKNVKISAKIHEIGKIKAIFGLGMTPI